MATYVGLTVIREEAAWRNISTEPQDVKDEGTERQTFEKVEAVTFSSEAKVPSKEVPAPERI